MSVNAVVATDDLDGIYKDSESNAFIVKTGVLVSSETGDAILFGSGVSSVHVSGTVASVAGNAIDMGNGLGGAGCNIVTISENGVVTAVDEAILLGDGFNPVTNGGTISSPTGSIRVTSCPGAAGSLLESTDGRRAARRVKAGATFSGQVRALGRPLRQRPGCASPFRRATETHLQHS